MILGYWKIRGLGNPIRFLLEYTGIPYEEKIYEVNEEDYKASSWFKEKFNLGLTIPNVPYLIDGDVKLTQCTAILRYIARKHNLIPDDIPSHEVEMMHGCALDVLFNYAFAVYSPQFNKEAFMKTISAHLRPHSDALGTKEWFLGKLSYVDFMYYEFLWRLKEMKPDCMSEYPNLDKFLDRFENLEPIKRYMQSDRYIKRPINLPIASYGGKIFKD